MTVPTAHSADLDPNAMTPDEDLTKTSPLKAKKLRAMDSYHEDPYPDWKRPTKADAVAVNNALATLHGMPKRPEEVEENPKAAGCGQVRTVIDALIRTILSQNTTNNNSSRAWGELYKKFGKGRGGDVAMFEAMLQSSPEEIAEAIQCGGLANVKGKVIYNILEQTKERFGSPTLEHLHGLDDIEAMKELVSFGGVGPKTASCVLLFCLKRESFAVDTHVYRISKALNWVPARATRETTQAHLEATVPDEIKYPLHILLVAHGKCCKTCAANGRLTRPELGPCPIKPWLSKAPKKIEVSEKEFPEVKDEKPDVKGHKEFKSEPQSIVEEVSSTRKRRRRG